MYEEILEHVRTTEDLRVLLSELDQLSASLYQVQKGTFEDVLNTKVRASHATAIRAAVGKSGRKAFLDGLKDELKQFQKLHLTLAFEPTGATLSHIHQWVRENVGTHIVLYFYYDPSVVGGALITFQGRHGDYSLRKKIRSL